MKIFFYLLLLLSPGILFAQDSSRKYFFKEVGWTIQLPADFTVLDSADDAARMRRGAKAIADANNAEADVSTTRTLISAVKNVHNYFNSTITPFNPQVDGDLKAANREIIDMMYKALSDKVGGGQIDTLSATEYIDGLAFDKFQFTITMKDTHPFNMAIYTLFYKGYNLGITYTCLDEEIKKQIELMLKESKFTK